MMHHYVSTDSRGQADPTLQVFCFFSSHHHRQMSILLVAIFNITTRCHRILQTRPLGTLGMLNDLSPTVI